MKPLRAAVAASIGACVLAFLIVSTSRRGRQPAPSAVTGTTAVPVVNADAAFVTTDFKLPPTSIALQSRAERGAFLRTNALSVSVSPADGGPLPAVLPEEAASIPAVDAAFATLPPLPTLRRVP